MRRTPDEALDQAVAPSRLLLTDQILQAVAALLERPGRTALSSGLVAVGAAMIVVVTALGGSAAQQVSARFDALRATVVEVNLASGTGGRDSTTSIIEQFPADARDRLQRLSGVRAAGSVLLSRNRAEVALTREGLSEDLGGVSDGEQVVLTDPGLARAAALGVKGRWISDGDLTTERRVAVLGGQLAERLGLSEPRGTVLVDGGEYAVVGIVEQSPLRPELLDAVMVARLPVTAAGDVSEDSVIVIETAPGAARTIADQAARQLAPQAPETFTATAPPDPGEFREALESDTQDVMRAFAGAGIVLGVLATVLVWWSSVSSRRAAIGLLRAAGATRAHIFRLIITECVLGGLLAGLVGTCVGVVAVAIICIGRDWQLVMDPLLPMITIFATTILGGLAGCLPAWAASSVDPVESLRSG